MSSVIRYPFVEVSNVEGEHEQPLVKGRGADCGNAPAGDISKQSRRNDDRSIRLVSGSLVSAFLRWSVRAPSWCPVGFLGYGPGFVVRLLVERNTSYLTCSAVSVRPNAARKSIGPELREN